MVRRRSAFVAILAVLCGLVTTPYVHAHQGIDGLADEQHPHGSALVHSHTTPHSHHDDAPETEPDGEPPVPEHVWPVSAFMAQQPAAVHAQTPVLVECIAPLAPLKARLLLIDRERPRAHGPPLARFSSLRAPPAVLPIFI